MNNAQVRRIAEWFEQYAAQYVDGSDGMQRLHEMKRRHTRRVVELCREFAVEMKWPEEQAAIAEATAWLHDVGRFSQLREFRTMSDAKSLNHAQRSCEVIEAEGALAGLPEDERRVVSSAILVHNVPVLPEGLEDHTRQCAMLVRDADKLDIVELLNEAIRTGDIERHPELILNISIEDKSVNPALLEEIGGRVPGSYSNLRTLSDFVLVLMSWVYDFNFAVSCRKFQRELFEQLNQWLPRTLPIDALVEQIRGDLAHRASRS